VFWYPEVLKRSEELEEAGKEKLVGRIVPVYSDLMGIK
jgi:hypothetical protein